MQLTEFRDQIASVMGTTPDAILNRQKKVHALMRQEAPAENDFGVGRPIQATPLNAAIVLLTVLDDAPMTEISERTESFWRAAYSRKAGPVCPLTGATTLGEAVVALIEQPLIQKRLDRIELEQETRTATLVWRGKEYRPSVFHIYRTPQDWKRAVLKARASGPIHTATIAGTVFAKVAALIERQAET
jgi:hypothetical protein